MHFLNRLKTPPVLMYASVSCCEQPSNPLAPPLPSALQHASLQQQRVMDADELPDVPGVVPEVGHTAVHVTRELSSDNFSVVVEPSTRLLRAWVGRRGRRSAELVQAARVTCAHRRLQRLDDRAAHRCDGDSESL